MDEDDITMKFQPGDVVALKNTARAEFFRQFSRRNSKTAVIVRRSATGSEWYRVVFPDGHEEMYPDYDLILPDRQTFLEDPEFSLADIELAEKLIQRG